MVAGERVLQGEDDDCWRYAEMREEMRGQLMANALPYTLMHRKFHLSFSTFQQLQLQSVFSISTGLLSGICMGARNLMVRYWEICAMTGSNSFDHRLVTDFMLARCACFLD